MEQISKEDKAIEKITLGFILSWILGIIVAITGVASLFSQPLVGILLLMLSGVLLPPVNKFIADKLKFSISGGLKFIIVIVLLGIIVATMSPVDHSIPQATTQVSEDTVGTIETTQKSEKEWAKIIEIAANANKQSEGFYLEGGQQRVNYAVSGGDFGMCGIYVLREGRSLMRDGGFPVVIADGGVTDETMMRQNKGDYYLDLQVTNASCAVEIYELR